MASLLIRYAHSRCQLRRGSGVTTVLGGVMIVLGVAGLAGAILSGSRENPAGLIVPAVLAFAFGWSGLHVLGGGALLLEAEASGAYLALISRRVAPAELRAVQVLWRFDSQRDKEVQVYVELQDERVDVTGSWLPFEDPPALAKTLAAQLGVPADLEERATS